MITQKEITQNMASQLGISGMPEDKQKIVIAKLGENITKRITIAILKNLPEEARTEFDSIQDEKNEEKLQSFLREKIPNIDELVQAATNNTVAEFKNLMSANN